MAAEQERVLVRNKSGLEVYIDLGRDMDRKTLDSMIGAGDLSLVEGGKKASKKEDGDQSASFPEGAPSEAWNKAQLTAYAEAKEVDLSGTTTKADILQAISAHEA